MIPSKGRFLFLFSFVCVFRDMAQMHKRIHKEENVQFTKRKDLILLMVSELDHSRKARGRDSCREEQRGRVYGPGGTFKLQPR